ncbi:MAG: Zn-dependent protease with chaperone function [Candidatus Endobugula sp.]
MNWIFEVFSDKFDQARLVAILISAVVAILVVLLNQWFVSRRSKRGLLIEKIEELFSSSNEYVSACRELMDALDQQNVDYPERYYVYPNESVNKLNDSITKMQMLCGLYFCAEKFPPDDFYIWRMPILEVAHKGKSLPEGEAHMAFEDSKAHIRVSREKLDELCKRLMNRYGH